MKKYLFLSLFFCFGTANANFTGGYGVSNWSQSLNGGTIDTSGAPSIIEIIGNDLIWDTPQDPANTDFTITALAEGMVSFDWEYSTEDDPEFDTFGWLLGDVYTQLSDDSLGQQQSGSTMFNVLAGDIFGFRVHSVDSVFGAATATISNFSAPASAPSPVPVPAAAWLFGSALLGFLGFSRRKVNT